MAGAARIVWIVVAFGMLGCSTKEPATDASMDAGRELEWTDSTCSPRPVLFRPERWVEIPPGIFTMGSPPSERGRTSAEDQVVVVLTHRFQMQRRETTQEEWESFCLSNPSTTDQIGPYSWADCEEPDCPVGHVNLYACGNDVDGGIAIGGVTHPTGLKQPNAWGLHDTAGNVAEWTTDQDALWTYASPVTDPWTLPPSTGYAVVVRGGDAFATAAELRAASRATSSSACLS